MSRRELGTMWSRAARLHWSETRQNLLEKCMKYAPVLLLFCLVNTLFSQPTSVPVTTDPKLLERMVQIDQRVASIKDMVADFEQQKITPLLKKPLISKGTVRVLPTSMLWETT